MKRLRPFVRQIALALLIGPFLAASAIAEALLRDDHPSHYVVQKGDTLWDIAGRFLRSPWRWPEIWHVNPQIANPHLIYPGDRLDLVYIDGKPRLTLSRGPVKLSPRMRARPWDGAIPTIPIGDIAPFLSRPYVLGPGELEHAPYIVSFGDEHLIGGSGVRAYARALGQAGGKYHVVRAGTLYRDADSGEVLGQEALYIGTVKAMRAGDPATVLFTSSDREAIIGDRLVPVDEDETTWTNFMPRHPKHEIDGSIIAVHGGVAQIGQYNVVVLDRGRRDGLEPGHVLRIDQRGETIRDVVTPDSRDTIKLPDEEAGLLMVFRTFDRVSFALVLNAIRPIHVLDRVRKP